MSATVKNVSEFDLLSEISVTYGRMIDWQTIPLESGESRKVTFSLELNEGATVGIGSLAPRTVQIETGD